MKAHSTAAGTRDESWPARRRRRAMAWWGARMRRLPPPRRPQLALFCDCEGHFAGDHAAPFAEAGVERLLNLLSPHGLHITFNVVAELCRAHPARIERIAAAGHEVGCHGWRHERPRGLDRRGLNEMLAGARRCYESLGLRVAGFRSPESAWSAALMRTLPRHGFVWNAEGDQAAGPYRIGDVVRLPVATDDWDLVDGSADAARLLEDWRKRLEHCVRRRGVLCIGVHEWVVGRDREFARLLEAWVEEVIRWNKLEVTTLGRLVNHAY